MMRFDPHRRRLAQAAAFGLLPWLAACGDGNGEDARAAACHAAVAQVLERYRLPGVLAGVRVAGRTIWQRAFGQADLAVGTPLALHSSFPIRSVTKSFTVTALLQLVREKRLALDHTIDRFVVGVPNGSRTTLADLSGMQSGLAEYTAVPAFLEVFLADLQRLWTPEELVAFAFSQPPAFLPGAQYQYCNSNTVLLGMVVEAVTGQALGDVMSERLFAPLGLAGTAYPSSAALPAPAATPYALDVETGAAAGLAPISPSALAGSGALHSTLADLLRWGDELGTGGLIGAELQRLRTARARAVTGGPQYDRYGLGIGKIGAWWGHTGSGFGFQIATMHHAANGTTIAAMANASPVNARPGLNFAQEVFATLAAALQSLQ